MFSSDHLLSLPLVLTLSVANHRQLMIVQTAAKWRWCGCNDRFDGRQTTGAGTSHTAMVTVTTVSCSVMSSAVSHQLFYILWCSEEEMRGIFLSRLPLRCGALYQKLSFPSFSQTHCGRPAALKDSSYRTNLLTDSELKTHFSLAPLTGSAWICIFVCPRHTLHPRSSFEHIRELS